MKSVSHVDLPRFMGRWYVIANIPTRFERGAHNAVESYELADDGTIRTTFTFRKGGFGGPAKSFHPRGFVREGSNNAVWGMRFVWPLKAEYIIAYLAGDYSETIIARSARDYVWLMARTHEIPDERYRALLERVGDLGYDPARVQRVPQSWPARGIPDS
ncbi:MAG: lipocalin family protein [Kofleriaceae bacterium]|nr:lipocalin family protein [Kofleriaceae bacterium]